jgi:hypothetical protein
MAHMCNPSYQGAWDREDHSSRTAQANSLQEPISSNSWAPWQPELFGRLRWGGLQFRVSLAKKFMRPPISMEISCAWCLAPVIPSTRRITVQVGWQKNQESISKITRAKRTGDMAQEAEPLPSKWEALSSKSSTTKKKKKKKRICPWGHFFTFSFGSRPEKTFGSGNDGGWPAAAWLLVSRWNNLSLC